MSDVFIIGAGCSVPYGFPTGRDLMQKLKNFNYGDENQNNEDFLSPSYLFDIYHEFFENFKSYSEFKNDSEQNATHAISANSKVRNKMQSVVVPFAQSIQNSMMVSTDEFLKNRFFQNKNDQVDFGKRLIAYEILKAEYESKWHPSASVDKSKKKWLGNLDWIQHLLSIIDQQPNWEKILKETVFLTFNYDRVLECGLYYYLTSDKQYSGDDAHAFIHQMKIHHINGYIGPLDEISYGWGLNGQYDKIATRMETVWEKKSSINQAEIEMYKEYLKKADRVFFLVFSYIPGNLESIGIERGASIIQNAKVYGTAMGMSFQNRLRISSYLDLKDFEKINEVEPFPEIEIRRPPFMSDETYRQEVKLAEKNAKNQATRKRKRYENRILKDASAVDLILDYYTFG